MAMTDEELVSRLAVGEMDALGGLYTRHKGMVCTALQRFAPEASAAEVEELAQDVFLALPAAAKRYEERSRFKSWLFGIAVRKARGFSRRAWVLRLFGAGIEEAAGADPTPERAAEHREAALRLLASLPCGQREVLVLHAVEGFDGEEIARILGISANTVWTRLHRARRAALAATPADSIEGATFEVKI